MGILLKKQILLKIPQLLLVLLVCKNIINPITLSANEGLYIYSCPIEYKVMFWIASNEGSHKRNTGYPYIISFNSDSINIFRSIKNFNYKKIDNRSIDCIDSNNCKNLTKNLIKNGITNMDLGAFQINYRYHKMDISKYFNLKDSYIAACNILYKLIKKYGYSWETISKYHSFKKKHQLYYLTLLSKKLQKEKIDDKK